MAIEKTEAVLLKKKDLRETSLLLTFFTRDFGKVSGVLKGARGARARVECNPLFFSLDQIVFYEKKKRDVFIISQHSVQQIFMNILRDWPTATVAYYILELVDVFTEPGVSMEPLFNSIIAGFSALDRGRDPVATARLFEVRLLKEMGLWPGSAAFELTKGAEMTLRSFESEAWGKASKLHLTRRIGEEIKKVTSDIIKDNIDRPLKTEKAMGGLL